MAFAPLLVGPIFGFFSGLVVTKAQIPSFIVTLGTLMMARSLNFVLSGASEGQQLSFEIGAKVDKKAVIDHHDFEVGDFVI